MSERRFHTISHLAVEANICVDTLKKRIRTLLSDPEIAKTFGPYPRYTLPLFQQRILIENIPELMHLKEDIK
jgi:hypothetical protein